MATRNLSDLGLNLQKIMTRLCANQNLLKLLYYEGKDPLHEVDLTETQIKNEIFENLIKFTPRVKTRDDAKSTIVLKVQSGLTNLSNDEFRNFTIIISVYVPLTQWAIKDSNLRPFAILGEIHKSLNGKIIDGLGKITGGDFNANFFSDEISSYQISYNITSYD